jgi:hypothetical protein
MNNSCSEQQKCGMIIESRKVNSVLKIYTAFVGTAAVRYTIKADLSAHAEANLSRQLIAE